MKSSAAADGAPVPSALLAAAGPTPVPAEPDDQDTGDLSEGVDEDALNEEEIDTDQITSLD